MQRILTKLFGFTVIHAMVITDIDDKIIKRSWEVNSHIENRDGCTSCTIIWVLYILFTTGEYLFNRDCINV